MVVGLIALNVFLAAFVLVGICGSHFWAIRTAHSDHRAVTTSLAAFHAEPPLVVGEPVEPEAVLGYVLRV